jgi:hypothetical protein
VAQAIIDDLELIQVQEQDRDALMPPPGAGQRVGQAVEEERPIS